MRFVGTSSGQAFSSSTTGSGQHPEALDLDALPSATGEAASALEAEAPGGVPYDEYFRFLLQFPRTADELQSIPLSVGPRFTLE